MSVNKVILIGNVGKDPQVRYIAENKPYASFPPPATLPTPPRRECRFPSVRNGTTS